MFSFKILRGKFARPFKIDSLAHAECLTAVLDLTLHDLSTELQRNHYKFSHVRSVQCEVTVFSIILDIDRHHLLEAIHNTAQTYFDCMCIRFSYAQTQVCRMGGKMHDNIGRRAKK